VLLFALFLESEKKYSRHKQKGGMKYVQNNVMEMLNGTNKKREAEAVGTKQEREQDEHEESWTHVLLRNCTGYV
jgi:hypothetical protein